MSETLSTLLVELAAAVRWQAELYADGLARRETERPAPVPVAASPVGSSPRSPEPSEAEAAARLVAIREELGDCRRCKLCEGRKQIVFGVGSPLARLMFVGEGPGEEEDRQGIPFVGKAGQLLTRMIAAMGLDREQVYIANIVKCRPPNNRDPEGDEVAACEPFLVKQIQAVEPTVLVALGRVAAQTLLRVSTPISRLRGKWQRYQGIQMMPTFHPAYLLRDPSSKKEAWEDLQEVMRVMGLKGKSTA